MNAHLRSTLAGTLAAVLSMPTIGGAAPLVRDLAPTPPMGFNNWVSFGCNVSESMMVGVTNRLIELGLADAGYRYVDMDDCWEAPHRDARGNLYADPARFPHGIKWLADYVHARGLKFGLYSSIGDTTCTGHLGSGGHYDADMRTFASWGVDFLKMDGCGYPPGFPQLTNYVVPKAYCSLDNVERMRMMYERAAIAIERFAPNMIMVVSAPVSLSAIYPDAGCPNEWTPALYHRSLRWASRYGQLWRAEGDSQADWTSLLATYETNVELTRFQRRGRWNDPDSLSAGDAHRLTPAEEQSQFTLWSMMAAPLMISANLAKIDAASLQVLLNRDIIAVDQDPLGVQGRRVQSVGGVDTIVKPLANGDVAVAFFNTRESAATAWVTLAQVRFHARACISKNLVTKRITHVAHALQAALPPHGTAIFRIHAR